MLLGIHAKMEVDADDDAFGVSELSYQTCYVFKPTEATNDDIDSRPRKKRKIRDKTSAEEAATEPLPWPLLSTGEESERNAQRRQDTYTEHWRTADSVIADTAGEIDTTTVDNIRAYIQSDSPSSRALRTAVIVSGADKTAFSLCLDRLRESDDGHLVVRLQASQAPTLQAGLKALIRNAVEAHSNGHAYDALLARHKRQIPMNFDLELLQQYVKSNNIPQIVVAIPDAETVDLNVFSELVAHLASWKDRIPFVLVLGLATTVYLFESRLSKATMRLLDAEIFALSSDKDVFFDMLEALQTSPGNHGDDDRIRPYLGPAIISSLADLAGEQSTTTHSFKQAIRYAYMTHFYANALSALLNPNTLEDAAVDPSLCEAIRNTASFQSHCAAILNSEVPESDISLVNKLLSDNAHLLTYSKQQLYLTFASLGQIHTMCLALAMIARHLLPTTSGIRLYHNLLTSHQQDTILESEAYEIISTSLPTTSDHSFASLRPKLPAYPLVSVHTPGELLKHLDDRISNLPPDTPTLFLREALQINARGPLTLAFNPKPRFVIERALSSPRDYLACECCTQNATPGPGHEPTSVLYNLLGDAGREINVMDLWTTFRDRITPESTKPNGQKSTPASKAKVGGKTKTPAAAKVGRAKKGKASAADGDGDDADAGGEKMDGERQALAHFHTALAELRHLGLVKSTSDRRLNKGVEVISRTTWHGL